MVAWDGELCTASSSVEKRWHVTRKVTASLDSIKKQFPSRSEIIAVLGMVVFVCHSWSIRGFLHDLPSLLLYFHLAEILVIFAYMMAFALLESLLVTAGLALISALLPSKWFRDGFAYKGLIFVLVGSIAAILLQRNLRYEFPSTQMLLMYSVVPLILITLLIFIAQLWQPLQKILLDIQDRLSIMLYIYMPIGLVSFFVVAFRNLF